MKWSAIAIVGAALMVSGQESKPHSDTHKGNTATKNAKATDTTAGQTVVVVNQQAPQGQQNSHAAQSPSYFSRLFVPENIPNIALVLVGVGGIIVAVKSLKRIDAQIAEMRRQVEVTLLQLRAMNEQIAEMSQQTASLKEYVDETKKIANSTVDSVELQKVMQQQWIQIQGWRIEGKDSIHGPTTGLTVVFDTLNPSSAPLTLDSVTAVVKGRSFDFGIGNVLPPNAQGAEKIEFRLRLDIMEADDYKAYKLVLPIRGTISYTNALRESRQQPFGYSCACGPDNYQSFSPLRDRRNQEKSKEEAN